MKKFQKKEDNQCQQQIQTKLIHYFVSLNSSRTHYIFILVLLTIETIQLLSASIVNPLPINSLALTYIKYVSNIFYPDYYLRNTALALYMIPFLFAVTLCHSIIFIYTFLKQSRLKTLVDHLFLLQNTILTLPLLLINSSMLFCTQKSPYTKSLTCYEGIHIFYIVMAILNILWIFICTLFVYLFYQDRNLLATGLFATTANQWVVAKFLAKVAAVIYIRVDGDLAFGVLYSIGFAGVSFANFAAFKVLWPYFHCNSVFQKFKIRCDVVIIFEAGFLIILHFFKTDNANIVIISSIILGLIFSQILIRALQFQKGMQQSLYLQNPQQQQLGQETYLNFFHNLLTQLAQKDVENMQMLHIIMLHNIGCESTMCSCHNLIKKLAYEKEEESQQMTKTDLYYFVDQLMCEAIVKLRKNSIRLAITRSCVLFQRINWKTKAVHLLGELLGKSKIGIGDEVSIRRLFAQFRDQFREQTDLVKFSTFSKYLWDFQRQAEKAVIVCEEYWSYLIQQDCSLPKIWFLCNKIQSSKMSLERHFDQKLQALLPQNLQSLVLYSQLFLYIYGVPAAKLSKHMETIDLISSQLSSLPQKEDQLLFRDNENIAVMVSVYCEGVFQFIRVSGNVVKVLNIRSRDLIGKSINCILHRVYQEFHDNKIKQYLNKQQPDIKQRNANVYLIDKLQNTINCTYKTRLLPSTSHGLQLLTFMRKNKESRGRRYLMYYYTKCQEQGQDQQYVKGDIIHIDAELKMLLLDQQNQSEEINDAKKNKILKIQDLVPLWDIDEEKILEGSEGSCNTVLKIQSIDLVHTDEISDNIFIKYLGFGIKNRLPKLSIGIFQPENLKLLKALQPKSQSQSFWQQNSQSRINLVPLATPSPAQPQSLPSIKNFKSLPTPKLHISAAILITVMTFLCVIPYSITPSYNEILKSDLTVLQILNQIGVDLFNSAFKIHQNVQGDAVLGRDKLDGIGLKMKQIYEIIGIQAINSQIKLTITKYQNSSPISTQLCNLNNALAYTLSSLLSLLASPNNLTSKYNLYNNIDNTYHNLLKIESISFTQACEKIRKLITRQIVFDVLQLVIVVSVSSALIYRIVNVTKLSDFTLMVYSDIIDRTHLEEFCQRCQIFLTKLRGTVMTDEERKKQKLRLILTNVQPVIKPLCEKRQQSKFSSFNIKQNGQIQNQQQRLLSLRKKITFAKTPPNTKNIISIVVLLSLWFTSKLILKYEILYSPTIEKNRTLNRNEIKNYYELDSEIERLIFNKAISYSFQKNVIETVGEVEHRLMLIDGGTHLGINVGHIFRVIVDLKVAQPGDRESLGFQQIQEVLRTGQAELIQKTDKVVAAEYQIINFHRNLYFLLLDIALGVLAIFMLWRYALAQQQISTGCILMLDMIKQGFGRDPQSTQTI